MTKDRHSFRLRRRLLATLTAAFTALATVTAATDSRAQEYDDPANSSFLIADPTLCHCLAEVEIALGFSSDVAFALARDCDIDENTTPGDGGAELETIAPPGAFCGELIEVLCASTLDCSSGQRSPGGPETPDDSLLSARQRAPRLAVTLRFDVRMLFTAASRGQLDERAGFNEGDSRFMIATLKLELRR